MLVFVILYFVLRRLCKLSFMKFPKDGDPERVRNIFHIANLIIKKLQYASKTELKYCIMMMM